ncbi:MAG: glycosyltransferase family 4 protein [Desulfobacterales bacterium]|nr:glycosyltransferase family 4 protein [Desulfobacterales bacterium]
MEKVKVLHVITRLDKGGSAENTLLTTLGLNNNKYDVVLIKGLSIESDMSVEERTYVDEGLKQAELKGVKLITVPSLIRRMNPILDIQALFRLYRLFLQEKPAIIHTHTSKAGILGRWASFFARVAIVVHTPHGHIFYGYYGKIKTKLFILLEKLTASLTDKIITLTRKEREEHIQFNISKPHKFVVIHSGVPLENFSKNLDNADELKKSLGIPITDLIVGTVGRLVEIKGHRYLLDAARLVLNKVPNVTFLLIGDGHLMTELISHASALGIKNKVIFAGWRGDVPQLIDMFDIFVLPSLNEGMGRVLVEAMAMGKPIVASDIGGIPDIVKDRSNGILFPPRDVDAMAEAIIKLLLDRELARKMGKEGKKLAYPAYDASVMLRKIEGLYEELLQKKKV